MLGVVNRTPFEVALVPGRDREERDFLTLIIKGTFAISPDQQMLSLADEQVEIVFADEYHGEPGESSLKWKSEVAPPNGCTDVALVGHVHAEAEECLEMEVSLSVGPVSKRLRIVGDRKWRRRLGLSLRTQTEPFEKMPLVYERAYGGEDKSSLKEKKHGFESRNPVGRGYAVSRRSKQVHGLALPNIEDASRVLRRPGHRPPPAGFGFIAPSWQPRLELAGTYDESWQRDRCPLLPLDFDERFFSAAHPDLIARPALAGGEAVRAVGVSPRGPLEFELPSVRFECYAIVDEDEVPLEPGIDTVLIEPDEDRVLVTWKCVLSCSRQLHSVEAVVLRSLDPSYVRRSGGDGAERDAEALPSNVRSIAEARAEPQTGLAPPGRGQDGRNDP
jgi:hypothetical protein